LIILVLNNAVLYAAAFAAGVLLPARLLLNGCSAASGLLLPKLYAQLRASCRQPETTPFGPRMATPSETIEYVLRANWDRHHGNLANQKSKESVHPECPKSSSLCVPWPRVIGPISDVMKGTGYVWFKADQKLFSRMRSK